MQNIDEGFAFGKQHGMACRINASVGIAVVAMARGRNRTLRLADEAMYRADTLSRACIVFTEDLVADDQTSVVSGMTAKAISY